MMPTSISYLTPDFCKKVISSGSDTEINYLGRFPYISFFATHYREVDSVSMREALSAQNCDKSHAPFH